jgi:ABC-type nitrate/sulfonate/bicarbonate transport system substrate-binding protein
MMRPVVALVVLIVLGGGCAEKRAAQAVEPVTIAVGTIPQFSLIHVAQAKGYFTAEGLAVTLQHHPFGKLALASLLDGKADLATCAETPLVFAELRGQHLSVLASTGTSTKNMAVLARTDAGIVRPSDLAGKRIGVTSATSGAFFLDTFLLRYQVDRGRVRLVELRPEEMGEALARGDVDAVSIWNPINLQLQRRFGAALKAYYEEALYAETSVMVGRRGFGQERPETARKVLRALLRAEQLFREDPEEAKRTVISALHDDQGLLDELLRQFVFQVRLDQSLLVLMEEEARWVQRTGKATRTEASSFLETMEPAPLLAVKPERVGLIR